MRNIQKQLVITAVAGSMLFGTSLSNATVLEEIIVTAQKREENLQGVPVAVSAIAGEFVQKNNVFDIKDITIRMPNVQYAQSPFQPVMTIRGLGASGASRGFESQIPLVNDGIYAGRPIQFLAPFFDLERVEVVKGPQAVMFGKNATAGVISVIAAKPTEEFEGYISGGYEVEYDGYQVEGVLSGAVFDTLGARLAVRYVEEGDYLFNDATGRDEGGVENFAIRGTVKWEPSDDFVSTVKIEHASRKLTGGVGQLHCVFPGLDTVTFPGLGSVECVLDETLSTGAQAGPLTLAEDRFQRDNIETLSVTLNSEYTLGEHAINFLAGYSSYYDLANSGSPDWSSLGLVRVNQGSDKNPGEYDQYSAELRLTSPTGARFEYIIGAYYQYSEEEMPQDFTVVTPLGIITDIMDVSQDIDTWSIFGSLTYNITDTLSASAQMRFTDEEKKYDTLVYRSLGLPGDITPIFVDVDTNRQDVALLRSYQDQRNEDNVDYSLKLKWDVAQDIMAYASYSKASKTGGYDFFPRDNTPTGPALADLEFEDESTRSFEVGIKSTLLDGSVLFNITGFYTEYDDMQQVTFDPIRGGFDVRNAEEVASTGFEADLQYAASDSLTLGAAAGYTDAKFEVFDNVSCPAFPNTGNCMGSQNIRDGVVPFAPEWSISLFAEIDYSVADYLASIRIEANYTDDLLFQVDQDPADSREEHWIANLRAALTPPSERWELSLVAKNLFDEDRVLQYSDDSVINAVVPATSAHLGIVRPGRTLSMQMRVNF